MDAICGIPVNTNIDQNSDKITRYRKVMLAFTIGEMGPLICVALLYSAFDCIFHAFHVLFMFAAYYTMNDRALLIVAILAGADVALSFLSRMEI